MAQAICYKEFIKNATNKPQARKLLKELITKMELNISQASDTLNCSRETIRNILNSDDLDFEKRKVAHVFPHKLKENIEKGIVEYRKVTGYGPDMIKVNLTLKQSTSTIYEVLKRNGLLTGRQRSYRRKLEVKRIKKKLKAFEKWQLDTKYLTDIPNLVGPISQGLVPKYEYTLRDMVTGTTFLGYVLRERSVLSSCTFVSLCLYHMQLHGIDTHYVMIQSDNGPEFIGGISKKDDYVLSDVVEKNFGGKFQTIPVRRPTFNSHVESFHGRIEFEYYDRIKNPKNFLKETQEFVDRWNLQRRRLKDKKCPSRVAREYGYTFDNCFFTFPVLMYDMIQDSVISTGRYPPDDLIESSIKYLILLNYRVILHFHKYQK